MKVTKKNQEMRIYGRHACLALFKSRPEDVIRVYLTRDGVFEYKELIRWCVDHKLAYHVVESEELDTITKSTHHEGLALIAKLKKMPTLKEVLGSKEPSIILALEEVENPHNLGAIMRTAAHFGASGILYEAKVPVALSAAAQRTAEGGAEALPTLQVDQWPVVFQEARRQGYKIFMTSSHQGDPLYNFTFPPKSLIFLGSEGPGLSAKLFKSGDGSLCIPGTGAVESLNVSNASALILGEWFRQRT